ncbi:MAG: crosslink repair DNA glycosylase YcaQ family protein [Paracoccus aminovorans]|nr:crosslink repair DNA glycosylase YcaQ family protein [Paracoccus aminovorans]
MPPPPSQAPPLLRSLPLLANRDARRLFLDRHLLLRPAPGPGRAADLEGVLADLGFVQVDSVNTLARAHDLILWSRRGRYRPAALDSLIARQRAAFEHWTHDAAVIPMRFYPMWRLKFARDEAHIQQRWPKWRRDGWAAQIDGVLRHVAEHGPVCSADLGGEAPRGSGGWWDWHPSKTALEYLWRSGRLAIRHRAGFRKVYDLAERVIPAPLRAVRLDDAEILDWALSAALARLGFATPGELAAFFQIATPAEAEDWCARARAAGRIAEIEVEGADGSRRRCLALPGLADEALLLPQPSGRVRLLSPFDPALRDRARAERLFGFRYRIEIFVPAPRRQYGYYVFPVLQGDRLIGRLDARRDGAVLAVRAFWPEPGQRMGKARLAGLLAELQRLLPLAGAGEIRLAPDWLRAG